MILSLISYCCILSVRCLIEKISSLMLPLTLVFFFGRSLWHDIDRVSTKLI